MKIIRTITLPAENGRTNVTLKSDEGFVKTINICEAVAIEDWLEENLPDMISDSILHIDRNDPDYVEKISPKKRRLGFTDLQGVGCYADNWLNSHYDPYF